MGDPAGFLEIARVVPDRRPVAERLKDWREVYRDFPEDKLRGQAARCMDCGIPFCQEGCPLGNIIPDWNDLVYRNQWKEAIERLSADQQFPRVHGPPLSGALRGFLRAGHQRRRCHDQAD